jgi:hypothetical protein
LRNKEPQLFKKLEQRKTHKKRNDNNSVKFQNTTTSQISTKKKSYNTTKNFRNHKISASNHPHPTIIIDITHSNSQVVKTLKRLTLISLPFQNKSKSFSQQPNKTSLSLSLSLSFMNLEQKFFTTSSSSSSHIQMHNLITTLKKKINK